MLDVLTTVEALNEARMTDRRASWLVTIGITVMAFVLRVINLGFPHKVIFDETYYAKDAWAILQSGYERKWPDPQDDRNAEILKGDLSGMLDEPSYIVHPPLGKMLIGWGEQIFGMDPFGWRIAACIFGALMVFFVIRLARRLSRSTLVGAIAGILVTFDGLAFVMSRIALLDIFQATFAVAAISALVADRDWFRHRLSAHLRRNELRDLGGELVDQSPQSRVRTLAISHVIQPARWQQQSRGSSTPPGGGCAPVDSATWQGGSARTTSQRCARRLASTTWCPAMSRCARPAAGR